MARNETKRRTARKPPLSQQAARLAISRFTFLSRLALSSRRSRGTARTFYKVVGTRRARSAPRDEETRESRAAHGVVGFVRVFLFPLSLLLFLLSAARFVLFLALLRPLAPPVYYVSVILFTSRPNSPPPRSNAGAYLTRRRRRRLWRH